MSEATFNTQPPNRQSDSFWELAEALGKYDPADLACTAGALQLLPANASRATRLEALSHSITSLPPKSGPHISSGKLRQVCEHPSLQALAHAEDPAENQFVEEFTFFGGSYLVFPGIAQDGEFILTNLCKAIFLDPHESLPHNFRSLSFQIVSSALHLVDTVARKAGVRRGTAPTSDRYEHIVVPDALTLQKFKNAVSFTKEELTSLLSAAKLLPTALDRLTCKAGDINLDDYDVVSGPILWRPLLDYVDRVVLLIPGTVVSAVRQALLLLAIESNLQSELAEAYGRAVCVRRQRK